MAKKEETTQEGKTLNLYQKLLEIQKHVIGLGQDAKTYDYKYVSGSKVLSHIKPLMNQYGLLLKQELIGIENSRQDYVTAKGISKSEILSTCSFKFTWIDVDTGDKDENLFAANGQNGWDKGVGSAMTYGERYFLLKFFHIATDEDDIDNPDRDNNKPDNQPTGKSDNRPELKEGTTEFHAAIKWLKEQPADGEPKRQISTIEKKYRLSKEITNLIVSQL